MNSKDLFAHSAPAGPSFDLRGSDRRKINIHLKISTTVGGTRKLIPGYARNISDSGLAAFIPAQLPLGHPVEIEFSLPRSSQNVMARAIVRAVNKFHYGLEFIALEEAAREQLRNIAQSYAQTA